MIVNSIFSKCISSLFVFNVCHRSFNRVGIAPRVQRHWFSKPSDVPYGACATAHNPYSTADRQRGTPSGQCCSTRHRPRFLFLLLRRRSFLSAFVLTRRGQRANCDSCRSRWHRGWASSATAPARSAARRMPPARRCGPPSATITAAIFWGRLILHDNGVCVVCSIANRQVVK